MDTEILAEMASALDAEGLAEDLAALAQTAAGEAAQRAWHMLPGMTVRACGRFSAEARAVNAARAGTGPDGFSDLAAVLARRARTDRRFACGFLPWLAAAQLLLGLGGDPRPERPQRDQPQHPPEPAA